MTSQPMSFSQTQTNTTCRTARDWDSAKLGTACRKSTRNIQSTINLPFSAPGKSVQNASCSETNRTRTHFEVGLGTMCDLNVSPNNLRGWIRHPARLCCSTSLPGWRHIPRPRCLIMTHCGIKLGTCLSWMQWSWWEIRHRWRFKDGHEIAGYIISLTYVVLISQKNDNPFYTQFQGQYQGCLSNSQIYRRMFYPNIITLH